MKLRFGPVKAIFMAAGPQGMELVAANRRKGGSMIGPALSPRQYRMPIIKSGMTSGD
jgi:hypothetical protein